MKWCRIVLLQVAVCIIALAVLQIRVVAQDSDSDWTRILELEKSPPASNFESREAARKAVLERVGRQESALRRYLDGYPGDPRTFDATLMLARVYAVQSDLLPDPARFTKAMQLLEQLKARPELPAQAVADVDFARLSLKMRRIQQRDEVTKKWLTEDMERLRSAYPADPRLPRLMVEVASFYDQEPKKKREMLYDAMRIATEEGLKLRISDDLKRLELLGRPLTLKFKPLQGAEVSMEEYRGSVVILCFFADWSPPSIIALEDVAEVKRKFTAPNLRVIGVSLDSSEAAAKAAIKKAGLTIPIYYDGKSWESPLVRRFGINTLPTIWIVDRKGILRMLSIEGDLAGAVRALIRER